VIQIRVIFRTTVAFLIILVLFSYSLLIVYGLEIKNNQKGVYSGQMNELITRKEELVNTYLLLENEKSKLQQELVNANNEKRANTINQEIANAPKVQIPTPTINSPPVTQTVKKIVKKPVVRKVTTRAS